MDRIVCCVVKMSAGIIKSALSSGFELSPGEAAFRPWWDAVEDNIVHTLVIIVSSSVLQPGPQ